MGASGWKYFVDYQANISAALQRLREDIFAAGRYSSNSTVAKSDLEAALKNCGSDLESTMEIFAARASDLTLPAEVRDKFAALVKQYRRSESSVCAPAPKPSTIQNLLEQQGASGTHSILDISRISSSPAFGAINPLLTSQLIDIFWFREA